MITIPKGKRFEHELQFIDKRTGTGANLTGLTSTAFVLKDRYGGSTIATGTVEITAATTGYVMVSLTITQTTALIDNAIGVLGAEVGDGVDFRYGFEDLWYAAPETAT